MIKYYKLFDLLNRREMKKTDLLEIISAPTLAKLSKGQNVQTDVIDKICIFLGCQPNDIMEVIVDEIDNTESFGTISVVKRELTENEKTESKFFEESLSKDGSIKVSNYVTDIEQNHKFAKDFLGKDLK